MNNYLKPIMLMFLCTFFIAIGQILWKQGIIKGLFTPSALTIIFIGFFFYGMGAILMILALKNGQLSVLHPIFSLGYVWVAIISPILFPTEIISIYKWIGIILIFL